MAATRENPDPSGDVRLKTGLLLFWALWLSIVCVTNVMDGLKGLGALPAGWRFASGNLDFLLSVTRPHGVSGVPAGLLFLGVIAWEAFAAVLHWRAFALFRRAAAGAQAAIGTAFAVSAALWCAFMLADEIFISYAVEATHLRLLAAELVTLLVIRLLPD